jgi:hypothetical protein
LTHNYWKTCHRPRVLGHGTLSLLLLAVCMGVLVLH